MMNFYIPVCHMVSKTTSPSLDTSAKLVAISVSDLLAAPANFRNQTGVSRERGMCLFWDATTHQLYETQYPIKNDMVALNSSTQL